MRTLVVAFLAAVTVHAAGWAYALVVERERNGTVVPDTQRGDTSIRVAFLSVPRPKPAPEPEPKLEEPKPQELPLPILAVPDKSPKPPEAKPKKTDTEPEVEPTPPPPKRVEIESEPVRRESAASEASRPEPPSTFSTPEKVGERTVLRAGNNPRATYPPMMAERGIEGRVIVRVWIADDGTIERLEFVLRDPHRDFNHEVRETIRRWRAERVGETDRVQTIGVRFVIKNGRPAIGVDARE